MDIATSHGHFYVTLTLLRHMDIATSHGHCYVTWTLLRHMDIAVSHGHCYVTWTLLRHMDIATSHGHCYVTWTLIFKIKHFLAKHLPLRNAQTADFSADLPKLTRPRLGVALVFASY